MQLFVGLLIVAADLSIEADGRALVLDYPAACQFIGEGLVNPSGCRAFEDTDLGMTAIRAAGMEAIDVRLLR